MAPALAPPVTRLAPPYAVETPLAGVRPAGTALDGAGRGARPPLADVVFVGRAILLLVRPVAVGVGPGLGGQAGRDKVVAPRIAGDRHKVGAFGVRVTLSKTPTPNVRTDFGKYDILSLRNAGRDSVTARR